MSGSRTRIRTTYTMVKLELSPAAYEEIKAKLEEAGYQHTFLEDFDGGEAIDMTHIAVAPEEEVIPVHDHDTVVVIVLSKHHRERHLQVLCSTHAGCNDTILH